MSKVEHFSHLIAADIKPTTTLAVNNPYDLSPLAKVDLVGAVAVEQALASAYNLYQNRESWLPLDQRIQVLTKTVQLMQERIEDLALEAAREGGKPLLDSRVEVIRAIDGVKLCIDALRNDTGEVIPMGINAASAGRVAFTLQEPIGVVVAVSAFNHPLNLIVHQVAPAVAAGCPVIVKPAPDTPLSCLRFIRLLREAGLPDAWAQALLTEDNQVAGKLVSDHRVGFLSFIGSARVGWQLRSSLAPGTRCALEHGGAAPVIVEADAQLDSMIPLLAKGGFYHAGQVCVSVQRIFVHESIARQVCAELAKAAENLVLGDPTLSETEIGPLIRPAEVERVDQWVKEAIEAGTELICGGKRSGETCYEATVLFNPPENCRVSTEEIFGPVIAVYAYAQLDQAVTQANSLPYAFQAAVFTQNIDTAFRAGKRLNASAVMVNDHTAFRVDWMPFAGLQESGLGVGGIPHTLRDMQVNKMMVFRSSEL